MSIVSEWHPPRPHCLPGCNRLDGHDGRDAGACMAGGEALSKPGPLDVPLRNEHAGVLVYDMVLPEWPESPADSWTPFRGRIPHAAKCYRAAGGFMVHVKPDCRC